MKYFFILSLSFLCFTNAFSQNKTILDDHLPDSLTADLQLSVDSLIVGCSALHGTTVVPNFYVSIEEHNNSFNGIPNGVDLYGVKLEDVEDKNSLIKALDAYCIYGWANHYFETDDFLIFSYSMRSHYFIDRYKKEGGWKTIKEALIQIADNVE